MYLRSFIPVAVIAVSCALPVCAQTPPANAGGVTAVSLPPAPLLPEVIGPWKKVAASNVGPTSPNPSGVSAPTTEDKEYGLKRSEAATYSRADGRPGSLRFEAREMLDSTGAYSAYTLSHEGLRACPAQATIGRSCSSGSNRLLFWEGDTLVSVTADAGAAIRVAEFGNLLTALPKPGGAKGAMPLLPAQLTKSGLDVESVRYAVGPRTYEKLGVKGLPAVDVIDFTKAPEVITGQYGHGNLTVIFYPTPTIAGDRSRAIAKAIGSTDESAPRVKRSGPIVAFTTGALSAAETKRLLDPVKYEATVSWNHPEGYIDETVKAASVMVKIMIFVFVMTFAALILGVFFGGARAMIRVARGKPISSLDDMEIISLGLRGPAKVSIRPSEKQS